MPTTYTLYEILSNVVIKFNAYTPVENGLAKLGKRSNREERESIIL